MLGCFAHYLFQFIPIYANLFEFNLNLFEFYRVFEWKEYVCEKVELCVIHHPMFGAAYILDEVFIWASGPSWTLY